MNQARQPRLSQADRNATRRRSLIGAALSSVARHGWGGTTVGTIARASEASRGLIAHHFGSKDGLLIAAYQHLCGRVSSALRDAAQGSGRAAADRLDAMLAAVFSAPAFTPENCSAFLAFWNEARTNPAMAAIHRELYAGYRWEVGALFERAARERGVALDPAATALGLIALLDGLWLELAIEPESFTVDQALQAARHFVDRALTPGSST